MAAPANNTIQQLPLLAFGMRFDDRATGNLKTYMGRKSTSKSTL
jgi:hypothetical protein